MPTSDTINLLGALTGLVGGAAGIIALALELSREWRERARLQLSATVAAYRPGGKPEEVLGHVVHGSIVNVGRRPIHITNIVYRGIDKCDRQLVPARRLDRVVYDVPEFPCRLDEGESATFRWPVEALQNGVAGIVAYDSLGRAWSAPKRVIRTLTADLAGKKSPA